MSSFGFGFGLWTLLDWLDWLVGRIDCLAGSDRPSSSHSESNAATVTLPRILLLLAPSFQTPERAPTRDYLAASSRLAISDSTDSTKQSDPMSAYTAAFDTSAFSRLGGAVGSTATVASSSSSSCSSSAAAAAGTAAAAAGTTLNLTAPATSSPFVFDALAMASGASTGTAAAGVGPTGTAPFFSAAPFFGIDPFVNPAAFFAAAQLFGGVPFNGLFPFASSAVVPSSSSTAAAAAVAAAVNGTGGSVSSTHKQNARVGVSNTKPTSTVTKMLLAPKPPVAPKARVPHAPSVVHTDYAAQKQRDIMKARKKAVSRIQTRLGQGATRLRIPWDMHPDDHDLYIQLPEMRNLKVLSIDCPIPDRYMHVIKQLPELTILKFYAQQPMDEKLDALCSKPHSLNKLKMIKFSSKFILRTQHARLFQNLPALVALRPFQMTRGALRALTIGPTTTNNLKVLSVHMQGSADVTVSDFDGLGLAQMKYFTVTHMDLRGEDGLRFINERLTSVEALTLNSCLLPDMKRITTLPKLWHLTIGMCQCGGAHRSCDSARNIALFTNSLEWNDMPVCNAHIHVTDLPSFD